MQGTLRRTLLVTLVVAALGAAVSLPASAGPAPAPVLGGLTELAGLAGCVTADGSLEAVPGVCTTAPEIGEANGIAISPDGRFAYVNGYSTAYGVTTLSRDPATGTLSPLAGSEYCHTLDGSGSGGAAACTDARSVGYGSEGDAMTMTRDGAFLYVGGSSNRGIAIFSRDAASGKLTQLAGQAGCHTVEGVSEDGADTCTDARFLDSVYSVTLSPDENTVYATAVRGGQYGVAIFRRDPTTGALTQLAGTDGCWSEDGSSEDGADTCRNVRGGGYANTFSITPDGRHAYLPHYSYDSLALLSVDPVTGKLSQADGQAGCHSDDGGSEDGADTCLDVGVLNGVFGTLVSRDGRTLYASNYSDEGVSIFRIDPATGALTPLAGTDHCITHDGTSAGGTPCADGVGFESSEQLTLSGDGMTLYSANYGQGVAVLSLDPPTGKATQLAGKAGCFTDDGSSSDGADTCTDIRSDGGTYRVALSPDDAFAYIPSEDGDGSITVLSRQASPVCANAEGIAPFATPLTLALTCRDPNGDPFSVELAGNPANGTAALQGSSATYTPRSGYAGADAFQFRGRDAASAGPPATAAITVDQRPGISGLRVASPFAVAKGRTPVSAKVRKGTRIRFRLSEAAAVRLEIQRQLPGRRVGGKCRKPSGRNAKRPRCKRWKRAGRVLTRNGKQGQNSVRFTGRIGRKALRTGRYRLVLTATDAVGSKSKATRRKFRVVKAKKG